MMRLMEIEALDPKPNLSRPAPNQQVFPYLLSNVVIERPNQVWSTDITYIPMRHGYLYLVAVMDWFSRFVLSWELSNTLETGFCLAALARVTSCAAHLGRRYRQKNLTLLRIFRRKGAAPHAVGPSSAHPKR